MSWESVAIAACWGVGGDSIASNPCPAAACLTVVSLTAVAAVWPVICRFSSWIAIRLIFRVSIYSYRRLELPICNKEVPGNVGVGGREFEN
jgi:hypothetical protein